MRVSWSLTQTAGCCKDPLGSPDTQPPITSPSAERAPAPLLTPRSGRSLATCDLHTVARGKFVSMPLRPTTTELSAETALPDDDSSRGVASGLPANAEGSRRAPATGSQMKLWKNSGKPGTDVVTTVPSVAMALIKVDGVALSPRLTRMGD